MLRDSMDFHKVGKDIDNILVLTSASDMDGHALPGVLVDTQHKFDGPTVIRSVTDKIPKPNVITMLSPAPDTQPVIQPETAPFGLLGRPFELISRGRSRSSMTRHI